MFGECVDAVAGFLTDASTGLGPALAAVPVTSAGDRPATFVVLPETTSEEAAQDLAPLAESLAADAVAVLVNSYESPGNADNVSTTPVPPVAQIDLLVRVVLPVMSSTPESVRRMNCATRAVLRACAQALKGTAADTLRVVRQVEVLNVRSFRIMEPYAAIGDAAAVASILLTLDARDQWAAALP